MSRPVVGICAAVEQAKWAAWDVEVNLSPRTYSRVVAASGALPLVLVPDDETAEEPAQLLDLVDALILAGGGDIAPANYGAEADPRTTGVRPERDRFELALATAALERQMPVLGICRGMELLNVARGGTLDQHVQSSEVHLHTPGVFSDHEVVLEPGSLAARAAGAERLQVRSHHHQGIGELGDGFAVSGHSVGDGGIEAIELPDRPFVLGVLWHTEEEERSSVVASLAAATRVGATQ